MALQDPTIASLRYPTLNMHFDTNIFSSMMSIWGYKCAQVFTNGMGNDMFYPLAKETDTGNALMEVMPHY